MYCYYAEGDLLFVYYFGLYLCWSFTDTVEKNILDLAARQGLSLYTKENSAGTLNISSLADDDTKTVDSPRKKVQKGDFISKYVSFNCVEIQQI